MLTAGPTDEAIGVLEQAQETTARLNAPILEAKALLWLSYAYREVRRLAESVAAAEGAGEIFRGHGRWREELRAWFSLGLSSAYQANADYALAVCDRMRALADVHDDTEGYARTFDIQAMGLLVAGRYREAISAADSAHTWYERAGIAYEKGYDHNMAGLAHLYLDEPEQAISRFETGLREAEEAQIPRLVGICLHNLAWWYWKQGDYAKAAASAHQAVDACHRSGNADMTPAAALLTACRAMLDDNAAVAAFALLEAARGVVGNADLPTAAALAAEASTLARRAGLTDLAAAAESLAKGTPPS
jgi:tetratricopeptide (TPR) repeat protein